MRLILIPTVTSSVAANVGYTIEGRIGNVPRPDRQHRQDDFYAGYTPFVMHTAWSYHFQQLVAVIASE